MPLLARLFRTKSVARIQAEAAAGISDHESGSALAKELTTFDLTALGIAAVIGAGIFSTVGNAAYSGGPAVSLLFIFTAIACGFAALCYAEFASMIPVAGSAYTYAYASFGELIAWIIGWDLILEYAIGNIAVAISWSEYFSTLLEGWGMPIPAYFRMDFLTAKRGFDAVTALLHQGQTLESIRGLDGMASQVLSYEAWVNAPRLGSLPVVCNLPALGIVILITVLVYVGIRESKRVSNAMVVFKVAVVLFVIVVGAFYIKPENWTPFAPNGVAGVLNGVAAVFFAYIGFDAISTTAEECRNPQHDLPRGIIYSLIICTALYVLVSLVLTGMVSYTKLQVADPMAFVFGKEGANLLVIERIVAVSAVVATTTVLLVFQIGQPRIWMAMSRDGLLPKVFASVHPRFKTPGFATIVAGLVVAIPSLFMNLTEVTDLTSIGTLFAFVLVCGGVLVLEQTAPAAERKFRVPYVNAKYIVPAGVVVACLIFTLYPPATAVARNFLTITPAEGESWLGAFSHKIPFLVFAVATLVLAGLCFFKNLSLIPVLGLLLCGYLMTELGLVNWLRFLGWLAVGLAIYFGYGFWHSRLEAEAQQGD
ncbi:amino acid permease [Chloracidobacterium validum]|uniref:Amino acid permease n=1 Tax=Chloracidobacterium validum TaxID=2821543 RepID=A0ABX8B7X8_9BACT|nr:amino acid permease [Chloracidobacterium validum]QUW02552.1 amino acid permease [Chloracidobacterium validum]